LVGSADQPIGDAPADILAHELVGHAIPMTLGGDTGNAVDNENKVRSEDGESLRKPEPNYDECNGGKCEKLPGAD
jgi:hypothetical protein